MRHVVRRRRQLDEISTAPAAERRTHQLNGQCRTRTWTNQDDCVVNADAFITLDAVVFRVIFV